MEEERNFEADELKEEEAEEGDVEGHVFPQKHEDSPPEDEAEFLKK